MASPDRNRRARSGSQLGKATTDRDRYLPPPSPTPGNERISFLTDGSNPAPMRIRRLPSSPALRRTQSYITVQADTSGNDPQPQQTARRRSSSDSDQRLRDAIQRPGLNTIATAASGLPTVVEERSTNASDPHSPAGLAPPNTGRARAASNSARSYAEKGSRRSSQSQASKRADRSQDYEAEVVDYLDVVDPEVSTLTTLNNVQNSLFVPYLGRWLSRQPTYDLSRAPTLARKPTATTRNELQRSDSAQAPRASENTEETEEYEEPEEPEKLEPETSKERTERLETLARLHTIKSTMSGTSVGHNYAVLPHGVRLEGWNDEEKDELNDHVRHLLHSRRAAFKRSMRAFGKYVRKPLGFFVTLYAFIITFWGAAWVIFLIGWIHAGSRQQYFVEICDQILTAMLVVIGIGLSPWRAVDTYHMIYIAHYSYKSWRLRRERGLPGLRDHNDLPETDPTQAEAHNLYSNTAATTKDEEKAIDTASPSSRTLKHDPFVLTPAEMKKLKHHQDKFAKSHTFYKPHETSTHFAFSIRFLITVVVLLDFHSMFQMALGGTTWGIYYRDRPRALTAVILACSITCNISGGIVISRGDKRSRKKAVSEQMTRQARTGEAMKRIEKRDGRPRLELRKSMENLRKSKEQGASRRAVQESEVTDVQRDAQTTVAL